MADAAAALDRAEGLLEAHDYKAATSLADTVLEGFDRKLLSRAALIRGKALLDPLLSQIMKSETDDDFPEKEAFRESWSMFCLAIALLPDSAEAKSEIDKLNKLLKKLPDKDGAASEGKEDDDDDEPEIETVIQEIEEDMPLDVIIVGAGASGVGMGVMLTKVFSLDPERVKIVERGEKVGETFRKWPREMHFISPSFNQQGWTKSFDLNSVVYGTSPAFTLGTEHPSGEQYATYLSALAEGGQLEIETKTEVTAVRPLAKGDGFEVDVASEGQEPRTLRSRYVVWAAGEFQYPRWNAGAFAGAELCMHNSSVKSWAELPGEDFVVIGGYESGMDAACNLAACGKRCTVVSSTAYWRVTTPDPSTELSPYTADRLRAACKTATPPRLLAPLRVFQVEAVDSGYRVHARWGAPAEHPGGEYRAPLEAAVAAAAAAEEGEEGKEVCFDTKQRPLLCTGFEGSIAMGAVKDMFEWRKEGQEGCASGAPLLNMKDESTKTPGLFLVGPAVRHGELSFCFVYKFRQRFGIVGNAIAQGLGLETEKAVKALRDMNMFLDDLTCCKAACGESC